jgi:hypothetical protein
VGFVSALHICLLPINTIGTKTCYCESPFVRPPLQSALALSRCPQTDTHTQTTGPVDCGVVAAAAAAAMSEWRIRRRRRLLMMRTRRNYKKCSPLFAFFATADEPSSGRQSDRPPPPPQPPASIRAGQRLVWPNSFAC